MLFTVTYRNASGALATDVVEAASRADCFAQMQARGTSVLSLKEGGIKPPHVNIGRSGGTSNKSAVIILSLLIFVLVGCITWWWIGGQPPGNSDEETDVPRVPKAVKDVTPVKPRDTAPVPAVTNVPVSKQPAQPTEYETYLGRRVVNRVERTNATGRVIAILTTDDGLTHRVNVHVPGNDRIILKYGTDHVLAAVLCVPDGTDAPPVPIDDSMEEEFLKSLKEPIEDKEDDTPEERRMKDIVRQAREDVMTLMDQGMSFKQIIAEHQSRAKENSEIRLKILQEAARIRESHGEEEELKYRNAMDAALKRMGIAPVGDGRPRARRGADADESAAVNESKGEKVQ